MFDQSIVFAVEDKPLRPVECPEWGGTIWIKTLSATELDAYQASCLRFGRDGKRSPDLRNVRAKLVVACACYEDGRSFFTDPEAVAKLGGKSARVVDRLYAVADELNKTSESEIEKLVEVFEQGQS